MGVVIYQSLIIYIFVLFCGVQTISVVINGSTEGLLGSNDTEIECVYTQDNFKQLSVTFMASNKKSKNFELIATYLPGTPPYLNPNGYYLNGRVTMIPITMSSIKAVMKFDQLMCIDGTSYNCKLSYTNLNGSFSMTSNNISISVQVLPSKPDSVALVQTQADSPVPTTKHMDYSTSSQSTAVTPTENEISTASDTTEQNTTAVFNHSTIQTIYHNTSSSSPSNDDLSSKFSYRTTTFSTQQTTLEKVLAEGDNITVVCTGEVGNPPAEYFFQKYRDGHTEPLNYTASATSIIEISENCSYYRTSNFTLQLTADDNNAVMRCVVDTPMAEPDMYVKTAPIKVYYEASMPNITIYPKKDYYVVGENTSILLICKSDGNPKPYYQWYKENIELKSTNESLIITDMNVTNSGNYTCKVNNTFNGDTHRNANHVQIKIINKADISTTQSSSIGSSSGVEKEEEKPKGNLGLVIGIVAAAVVTVIVVMIVIIACRRRKSKSPTSKHVPNSFDDSKPKPVTEPRTGNYDYIALEDDAPKTKSSNDGLEVENINKHNEEYLKKQEEEEKKKNESNTPPQPAVYAQVNEATKSKNKLKTETADKQEEDTYAESQEGICDKAGDRRHIENKNVEHFDSSINSSKQDSNGDTKLSIQTSQLGSYANQGFEKDEIRKVATVSPTVRSSSGSENDEQTTSNRNSQSKKGYENIKDTEQTVISEEDSSHRTAL